MPHRAEAHEYLRLARQYHDKNELMNALVVCNRAVTVYSDFTEGWVMLAQLHEALGDTQHTLEASEQALMLEPQCVPALYSQAWAKGNLHDYSGEIGDATRAYELDPTTASTYFRRLGRAHAGLGNYDKAIAYCNDVLALEPTDYKVLVNRAGLYKLTQQYSEALEDMNRVVALQSMWHWGYFGRGQILIDLERYEEAIKDFNRAIELDPGSTGLAETYYWRSVCFQKLGESTRAQRDRAMVTRLDPNFELRTI